MKGLKIAVVIPDRNDRKLFLEHSLKMLKNQTLQPDVIELVNDKAEGNGSDLTYRYRVGFERALKKGADVVLPWENDDWYRVDYISTMIRNWDRQGRSDIFGIGYSIYYHIINREFMRMDHGLRASMMNTLISKKGIEKIKYPDDKEIFLDLKLWSQLNGQTFIPNDILSIGIKHNVGLCGGKAHKDGFKYQKIDNDMTFLKGLIDKESLKFYENYV